jgi:pimeloyl-ACP methyl ester carboxylesterase
MKIIKRLLLILLLLIIAGAVFLYEGDLPATEVDARYSNAASKFLNMANGARVHYRDEGNRSGLPVVLIHGGMASLHTWEPWVNILGERYRIITLDLPAFGLTGQVPNAAYGAEAFTNTINAVVNTLGIEQFVLGGNSMGGKVTWLYTLAHPEQVLAMILIGAGGPDDWQQQETNTPGGEERNSPIGFRLRGQAWFHAIGRNLDPSFIIERGLRSAYNNSPVFDQKLRDRYYELILREGSRAAILQSYPPFGGAQSPIDLSVLTQPALIMWGAQDAINPVSLAEQFERALPNTSTVIYDDLGHIPMEEDPERSAADVLKFLDGLLP